MPGVEGSAEHEAAEHAETAGEHGEDEERLLGVDVESPFTVTIGVVVSLALAVGLWLRQRRWLAAAVAVVAVVFAAFDVAEVVHQVRESGGGLVVLAPSSLPAISQTGAPRRRSASGDRVAMNPVELVATLVADVMNGLQFERLEELCDHAWQPDCGRRSSSSGPRSRTGGRSWSRPSPTEAPSWPACAVPARRADRGKGSQPAGDRCGSTRSLSIESPMDASESAWGLEDTWDSDASAQRRQRHPRLTRLRLPRPINRSPTVIRHRFKAVRDGEPRDGSPRAHHVPLRTRSRKLRDQRVWCGKMWMCPKLMVPLQIDLAIGVRRYRFGLAANPTCRRLWRPGARANGGSDR